MFGNIQYFSEYEILGLFREFDEPTFKALPSHCGQEVIKNLFENIKSWQRARKEYGKDPSKFLGKPKMPKYKKELSILGFNNGQIKLKNGYIHFPKMIGISPIKTKIPKDSKLGCCRVVPKNDHFVVEFVYEVKEKTLLEIDSNQIGIDLGLNNLVCMVSTNGESEIINGKPLKAINNFYNKRIAKLKSKLPLLPKSFKTKTGNRIQVGKSKAIRRLALSRNNKIKNYIHHASKYIVNFAQKTNCTQIVIGNNKNWKQGVNLGSKINQSFVSIPYSQLINQIEYKCKLNGITVYVSEESYTSKCSSYDLEEVGKHEVYVGKRTKRGLFRTKDRIYINADANGAVNSLRKVSENVVKQSIDFVRSAVIAPRKLLPITRKVA